MNIRNRSRLASQYLKLLRRGSGGIWQQIWLSILNVNPSRRILNTEQSICLRQICADRYVKTWLQGSIIPPLSGSRFRPLVVGLPTNWVSQLHQFNLTPVFFLSWLIFSYKVVFFLLRDFAKGLVYLAKSFQADFLDSGEVDYYVVNISREIALALAAENTEYDLTHWIEKNLFKNLNGSEKLRISHPHKGIESTKSEYIFSYMPAPFENIPRGKKFIFLGWLIRELGNCLASLMIGRWEKSTLFGEQIRACIFNFHPRNQISNYLFLHENFQLQPLWVNSAERKGSIVTNLFNGLFDQPDVAGWQGTNKPAFRLYSWKKSIVWDTEQASMIRDSSLFADRLSFEPKPPLLMRDDIPIPWSRENSPLTSIGAYVTKREPFDVYIGSSSNELVYSMYPDWDSLWLSDVTEVVELFQHTKLVIKPKRNFGFMKDLEGRLDCDRELVVDPRTSAVRLAKVCDLNIVMPFSSVAVLIKENDCPVIFYQPYAFYRGSYRSISLVTGVDELKNVLISRGLSDKKVLMSNSSFF